MIDNAIASETLAALSVGEQVEYDHPDGGTFSYPILKIDTYAVVVQLDEYKRIIPVSWLHRYKEIEAMKMPQNMIPPSPGEARRRGRPTNTERAAQAEAAKAPPAPAGSGVAPGSVQPATALPGQVGEPIRMAMPFPGATPRPDPDGQVFGPGMPPPGTVAHSVPVDVVQSELTAPAEPRHLVIEQAEGNSNWIDDSVEKAIANFREDIYNIMHSAINEPEQEGIPTAAAVQPRVPTCFDCGHIDKMGNGGHGICAKFNMVPPMFVVVAPNGKCPEFFDIESDIPF